MVEITLHTFCFSAPESWAECTPSQREHLYGCTYLKPEERTDTILQAVAQIWLGATDRQWQMMLLSRFQWEALQEQFAWVFVKPTGKPVEAFTHEGQTYLLPEDDFENTTALELALAMMYWAEFAHPETPDKTALDKLIATLCRSQRIDWETWQQDPDFNGDLRVKYNEVATLKVAATLETLPLGLKMLLLDYFNAMAERFLDSYEEIFGSNGQQEPLYDDGRGWLMLLKDVAKEGYFGPFDAVCKQPAHLLFSAILDDTLKAELQQQQQNDHH
ncbi:MAG: hypothetical protein U0X91_20645 [Spirosomataceae bacterium]